MPVVPSALECGFDSEDVTCQSTDVSSCCQRLPACSREGTDRALGLVLGKPLGITLFAWLAVRVGLATLPAQTSWRALHGVSWLGGIGFTMSLFIAALAFAAPALLNSAKVGILGASLLAGAVGGMLLRKRDSTEE
jgi:Na+/H+ antiporter NhaA